MERMVTMIRKSSFIVSALLIGLAALSVSGIQQRSYAAIVVRGDIYADWALATAYSMKERVPVLTLFEQENLEEVLGILSWLASPKARVLIVGDYRAVSFDFQRRLEGTGVVVDRVGGPTRAHTSVQMIVQGLWAEAEAIVVADGTKRELYIPALNLSGLYVCPLVFSEGGVLPETFQEAIDKYLGGLKSVYVVQGSLTSEEMERLSQGGFDVKEVSPSGQASPVRRFSWSYVLRWLREELFSASTALGLFVGSAMVYLFLKRRRTPITGAMEFLTRDERMMLEIILREGEVRQEDLPALMGLSRPKISRLTSELVSRRILEKDRVGKTYALRATNLFKRASGV